MPEVRTPGRPTTRRYSPEERAQAVRLVRAMRAERGVDHGCVQRVAKQLGYGTDEGLSAGTTTVEAERIKALEQENRELKPANEILRRASAGSRGQRNRGRGGELAVLTTDLVDRGPR
jgi:transposase